MCNEYYTQSSVANLASANNSMKREIEALKSKLLEKDVNHAQILRRVEAEKDTFQSKVEYLASKVDALMIEHRPSRNLSIGYDELSAHDLKIEGWIIKARNSKLAFYRGNSMVAEISLDNNKLRVYRITDSGSQAIREEVDF